MRRPSWMRPRATHASPLQRRGAMTVAATAVSRLVAGVRKADVPSVARALTLVENRDAVAADILHALWPSVGRAWRIGITGPPGAGKSTLVAGLIAAFRKSKRSVGVVA